MSPRGDRIELAIERLATGGDGVAHLPDGRVCFVPDTAPGDRAVVRIEEERKRFARGRLESLIEAGPGRVAPRCRHVGSCGGCTWQHLDPDAQRLHKRRIVADCLARIGGLSVAEEAIAFEPSPPWGTRLRCRALVGEGEAGFRGRASHALCAVSECPVLAPALERALVERAAGAASPGEEVELCLDGGDVRIVRLGGAAPGAGAGERAELPLERDPVAVSPGVFAQANLALLEPLRRAVRAALDPRGDGERLLELYAGAGFFTLALARHFELIWAFESSAAAAADLQFNCERAGAANVRVSGERAEAAPGMAEAFAPTAVLVDPPRSGLDRELCEALAALGRRGARRLAYLSCDPATLARDLAILAAGYRVESVRAFDLFPQTPHVECLALLRGD